MPVLPHGVAERLPPRIVAGENLQFAAAIIVKPFYPPLARCSAILENVGRLSAGLARLCHHVSGSELSERRRVREPAAPPPPGGRGIWDERKSEAGRGTYLGHAY